VTSTDGPDAMVVDEDQLPASRPGRIRKWIFLYPDCDV
jgi:hypothetical protein